MKQSKSAKRKAQRRAKYKRRRMRASGQWKRLHQRKRRIQLRKQARG